MDAPDYMVVVKMIMLVCAVEHGKHRDMLPVLKIGRDPGLEQT